jgi:transmembrane sensor
MLRLRPKTATEWLVRLNAGTLTPGDRRALMRWLSADPQRLKELETAQAVSRMAAGLADSSAARMLLARDLRAHNSAVPERSVLGKVFKSPVGVMAAAACAAALVLLLTPGDPSALPRLKNHGETQTAIGQITSYELPDKSQITIAAGSAVTVDFTGDRRDVMLDRGEAFFDVRHDAARPFVIKAGERKVTVTGTKFNVNSTGAQSEIEVSVVEGRVNVSFHTGADGIDDVEQIAAGDVIFFPAKGAPVRRNLTPEQAAAWRARKLYFDSANLSQVLAEVNRYAPKPLVVETPETAKLMLTGQFQAGDVQSVLTSLRQLYGIEAHETTDQWLLTRTAARANPRH